MITCYKVHKVPAELAERCEIAPCANWAVALVETRLDHFYVCVDCLKKLEGFRRLLEEGAPPLTQEVRP